MIRLRRAIERGLRQPLLGPLLVITLAFLLVLTVLHGTHDQMHEAGLVCVALVAFVVAVVRLLFLPARRLERVVPRRRGPPRPPQPRAPLVTATLLVSTPLRL